MIEFFKEWCENIVVVIIVCVIIEMILPESKNKKYVQVIIGIYVAFTILNPIITNMNIEKIDFNKFFKNEISIEVNTKDENLNIEKVYLEAIKKDIKNEIYLLGFDVKEVEIITDIEYKKIEKIKINISNKKENKIDSNNILINEIKIEINSKEKINITEEEKQKIINKILEMYEIEKENIEVY